MASTFNTTDNGTVLIGSHPDIPSENTWDGLIDDVQIYNRALTAEEVTSLYNGTSLNKNITLAEGSHTYKIYAQDLAGNTNESSEVGFGVDTTPPVTSPTATANGNPYTFEIGRAHV